ncbi:MAG: hypothetical protein KDN22_04575 [Verrucomicrobiae bacterium]|nr:hypothetical protein [Verrucomicrobiae bacterium]
MKATVSDTSYAKKGSLRAFTLAELIVVMGVIAIMVVLGANLGLQSPIAARMRSSVGEAAGLFEYARELAMAKQVRSRVWINNGTKDVEKDLRYMVVAVEDRSEIAGNAEAEQKELVTKWRAETAGKYLSAGVFFQPIVERKATWSMRSGTEGAGDSWYYYEFAPDGSSTDGGFILTSGARPVTGGDVMVVNDAMRDGFLVRRSGYLTFLKSPDQVDKLIERTRAEEL